MRAIEREFADSNVAPELLDSIRAQVRNLAYRLHRIADAKEPTRSQLASELALAFQQETTDVEKLLATTIQHGVHAVADRLGLDEKQEGTLSDRATEAALALDRELAALSAAWSEPGGVPFQR